MKTIVTKAKDRLSTQEIAQLERLAHLGGTSAAERTIIARMRSPFYTPQEGDRRCLRYMVKHHAR